MQVYKCDICGKVTIDKNINVYTLPSKGYTRIEEGTDNKLIYYEYDGSPGGTTFEICKDCANIIAEKISDVIEERLNINGDNK